MQKYSNSKNVLKRNGNWNIATPRIYHLIYFLVWLTIKEMCFRHTFQSMSLLYNNKTFMCRDIINDISINTTYMFWRIYFLDKFDIEYFHWGVSNAIKNKNWPWNKKHLNSQLLMVLTIWSFWVCKLFM